MASQGSKVLASDYNNLQSTVATILGAGSGTLGYGQTVLSSAVSNVTATKITSTQWSNLVSDILTCAYHQGVTFSTVPVAPNAGQLVFYHNDTSLGQSYDAYSAAVTTIGANPQVFPAAGQYSGTVLTSPSLTNMAWGNHYHTVTLNFGSNAQFRYFFNAGGRIEISPTISGGGLSGSDSSTNIDISWQTIFNRIGTIYLYWNSTAVTNTTYTSGSGQSVTVASSIGAYQLTTSSQVLVTSVTPSGGTYYPNEYQVTAYVDNTSAPTQIYIQCALYDTSYGSGSSTWAIREPVDSTITNTVSYTRASGSYVSVVPPSVAASSFT
jgi:hypothetical protein